MIFDTRSINAHFQEILNKKNQENESSSFYLSTFYHRPTDSNIKAMMVFKDVKFKRKKNVTSIKVAKAVEGDKDYDGGLGLTSKGKCIF